jgi:hypothetical protein
LPHAVLAVAQWVASTVFFAAGAQAGAATLAVAAAAATVVAEVVVLASASSALTPKVGGDLGTQVDFKADPRGPIPYAVGRTATAGNEVFGDVAGPNNIYLSYATVLSGAGPIDSYESFLVNDAAITFGTDAGEGASGFYQNRMWRRTQLGASPESGYLHWTATGTKDTPADHSGQPGSWGSAHKLSGYAADFWGLQYNTTAYSGGQPKRLVVAKWVKVYDPRLDSTYPGGSGPQRALNESTYAWSENPYLHALTWLLGRVQNGKRILGVGAPIAMIDVAAYVEGANVADANAWKCGGVVYSTDDKWEVLKAFLQAGGGKPMRLGARISCLVNTPRVSLATLTGADVVGQAVITGTQSRRTRKNTIWPKYREEAQGWEVVTTDTPVQVASYVTEDGGVVRSIEVEYKLVQQSTQAGQLARYDIEDGREFAPVVLPCKPRWMGYKPGDVITVTEPELGLSGQDMLILKRDRDPLTMVCTLTMRSETSAKHAYALGQALSAPSTPGLTGVDPNVILPPGAAAFAVTGASVTPDRPTLVITGASDNPNAKDLLVRYRKSGATDWTYLPAVDASPEAITVEIGGLAVSTAYEVESAYRSNRGAISTTWRAEGTITAGAFSVAAYLAALPSKNLWRKIDWVGTGATSLHDPLAISGLAGQSLWGWDFTGIGTVGVGGKTFGNTSDDYYSFSCWAKMNSGAGTFRAGFRTPGGAMIAGLADQIFTATGSYQRFRWQGLQSADAAFPTAIFYVFTITGDVPATHTLTVTDLMMEYGSQCSSAWTPSPDDVDLLRYAGYLGELDADKTASHTAGGIAGQGALATLNQATWATQVTGLGKPDDYANKALVTVSATAPVSPTINDIWVKTVSGTPDSIWAWNGSAWVSAGDITLTHTSGGIVSQGSLATLNAAAWATQVTGLGKPDDYANKALVTISASAPGSPTVNDIWVKTVSGTPDSVWAWNGSVWVTSADTTSTHTASGIAGQGSLATLSSVIWASQVLGTGKPADFADVTSTHTAAGFSGQGSLATLNDLSTKIAAGTGITVSTVAGVSTFTNSATGGGGALTVTLTGSAVWSGTVSAGTTVATSTLTGHAAGGSGTYQWGWAATGGDQVIVDNPSLQSTTCSRRVTASNSWDGSLRLTVRDSDGKIGWVDTTWSIANGP